MSPKTKFNKRAKKRLIIESILVFFILLAPFLFKIHEYFPSDSTEPIDLFFFKLGSNGFADIETHAWFFLSKFVPFYLLLLWFFTCKHWWYHIILIPIIMYAFQIFELYHSDDSYNAGVDSENILWILPVCIVVIPFVYFIRIKLYDKYVHGIDLEAINEELSILKAKKQLQEERKKLEAIKEQLSKRM